MERGLNGISSKQNPTIKIYAAILVVVATFLYVAFTMFYFNLNIRHTIREPIGAPGMLKSDRYSFSYWLIFCLAWKMLLFASVVAIIIFSGLSKCCTSFFYAFFMILLIVDVVGFLYLLRLGIECNGAEEAGNICNHMLRCCDPALNTNPASGCLLSTSCVDPIPRFPNIVLPVTINNLPWDENFKVLFWMDFVFVILDVLLLIAVVALTLGSDPKRIRKDNTLIEEAENQLEEEFVDNAKRAIDLGATPSYGHSLPTNNGATLRANVRMKAQINK